MVNSYFDKISYLLNQIIYLLHQGRGFNLTLSRIFNKFVIEPEKFSGYSIQYLFLIIYLYCINEYICCLCVSEIKINKILKRYTSANKLFVIIYI